MKSFLSPPLSNLPHRSFDHLVDDAAAALPELPDDPSQILFALDIDGTIRHPQGVTPTVLSALQDAQDAGANLVIATGRGIASTRPVVEEIGLTAGWGVCSNGALTVDWSRNGHVSTRRTFDPRAAAEEVLSVFPDAILAADEGDGGLLVWGAFPVGELMFQVEAASLDHVIGNPTTKLVVRVPGIGREEFAAAMESLHLDGCELAVGWTSWADIGPAGVTKASALAELADNLGVPAHGTIAIGDGTNDISMLQWAGHGVAMGGSLAEVTAAADATTGPVEQDGAAAVIEAVLRQY